MNISVNQIYQQKLAEIQSRIPNIEQKTSNFSNILQKATENMATTTEAQTTNSNKSDVDPLAVLTMMSNTSMASALMGGDSSNNSLSNSLNTMLLLQQSNLLNNQNE